MGRPSRRSTVLIAAGACVAAAAIIAGLVIASSGSVPAPVPAARVPAARVPDGTAPDGTAPVGAGAVALRDAGRHAAPPLRVVSVTPVSGSSGASGTGPITVTFTARLAPGSAMPVISPAVAGQWKAAGDTAVFTPDQPFAASTRVSVRVPGGVAGPRSVQGGEVPRTRESSFATRGYAVLRLQQLLARLGYLPLRWTGPAVPATRAAQLAAAYDPPAGTFGWDRGYPARLRSFWRRGAANLLDGGAVTGFQADHGLTPDGTVSPAVWSDLLTAAIKGQRDTHGYSYAIASQSIPETLTIWHDGREVFRSLANTGIAIRPTPVGTTPVYEKLPFQVMQGTNPDGSHYADPVEWVSYFNGGSAVHYFPRPWYGYPQSLGCVELPASTARAAYRYLPYGTLVTVTP